MEFSKYELQIIGNAIQEKMRKLEQRPNYANSAQYKRLQKLDRYYNYKLRSIKEYETVEIER